MIKSEPAQIVVLDDDEAVRLSTRMMLEVRGYEVTDFASAEALLAHPGIAAADCLILDIDLPGMNGLDLLVKLRTRGIKAPAIIVSGNGRLHAQRAKTLGAAAFLRKPLAADELATQLGRMFGER